MLERGYLEFLTPTADTPHADSGAGCDTALRRRARDRFRHRRSRSRSRAPAAKGGFEPGAPVALQRPIGTETGEDVARFTVVRVPPGKMAEGRIQFCQHHTPQLALASAAGSSIATASWGSPMFFCASRTRRKRPTRYSRFLGLPTGKTHGAWRIETGHGELTFDRREGARARNGDGLAARPTCPGLLVTRSKARIFRPHATV